MTLRTYWFVKVKKRLHIFAQLSQAAKKCIGIPFELNETTLVFQRKDTLRVEMGGSPVNQGVCKQGIFQLPQTRSL